MRVIDADATPLGHNLDPATLLDLMDMDGEESPVTKRVQLTYEGATDTLTVERLPDPTLKHEPTPSVHIMRIPFLPVGSEPMSEVQQLLDALTKDGARIISVSITQRMPAERHSHAYITYEMPA